MILVGQYDSFFARRVGTSLRLLGLGYQHDTRSVFADAESMARTNPLGRVPSLILNAGEILIDSGAILDWLDEQVGPERALVPPGGDARRKCLQITALACGIVDKALALVWETTLRPSRYRWPEGEARFRRQAVGGLAGLAAIRPEPWYLGERMSQADVSVACMVRYVRLADGSLLPEGRHPVLDELSRRCEALDAFKATWPADYVIPKAG